MFPKAFNLEQQTNQIENQTASAPLRTYAYDVNQGEFVQQPNGKAVYVDGVDAVLQNAQKAITTERYTYPIYSSAYGSELKQLIRAEGTREWKQAEAERLVSEAVRYLIGVERCANFVFEWNRGGLRIEYDLVTNAEIVRQEVNI